MTASGLRAAPRLHAVRLRTLGPAALAGAVLSASLLLRTHGLGAGYWIDEGLSVGISSHAFVEIPHLLRQDGSPPLYYLLLHAWMRIAGTGEVQTHLLSLLFALLTVPAALWGARTLFGPRAGWIAAALAALHPYVTWYAQETRMYSLLVLLSVLAAATFGQAFVQERARAAAAFAVLLALMLYTHNWALFFAAGAVLALGVTLRAAGRRRALLRRGLLSFGAAGLLFAPWLPTLLFQIEHTGAPWSSVPSAAYALRRTATILGGDASAAILLVGGALGFGAALRGRADRRRTAAAAMLAMAAGTLVSAWAASQVSPAWADRYFAVVIGPLVLFLAYALDRAGRRGLVALALTGVIWLRPPDVDAKSTTRAVLHEVAPLLRPGDLVISTHPERTPVLHIYLPAGLRFATPLGPVADPRVMDWRDALPRLRAARTERALAPLLARLPAGRRVLLVRPVIGDDGWDAPWTRLVSRRSAEWGGELARDRRFVRVASVPPSGNQMAEHGIWTVVYRKVER